MSTRWLEELLNQRHHLSVTPVLGIDHVGIDRKYGYAGLANTPPAFLAVAEDDPLAGATPELHVYCSGQHGFSMMLRGTSDHWIDERYWWMTSYGLVKP
jgi:hypothetical protein